MNIKLWVAQLRYPYSAGILAVTWIGSAIMAMVAPEISITLLLASLAAVSLLVAAIGFSPSR